MANSPTPAKSTRFIEFALILVLAYLLSTVVGKWFFPSEEDKKLQTGVQIHAVDETVRGGNDPIIVIKNYNDRELTLQNACPMPPFEVFRVGGSGGQLEPLSTTETALPCIKPAPVAPDGEVQFSLAPWKFSLFDERATYEVRLKTGTGEQLGTGSLLSARFEVYEPGTFVKLFRTFITKPFLNFLIFVASVLPDHNLGIAIIVLTLVVKLLLFWPTQRALEGQKKMQLLQPKLEAVKRQHKDNPQKMQEETMRLWKEHGVNPVQSCLPILLQFPILIGLFYVIKDSSVLATSQHLIYPFYDHLTWDFNTMFLGLDLTLPNWWLFSPLLVVLQYLQMKLSFQIVKNKSKKDGKQATPEMDKAQEIQQNIMLYAMPLMIGFFAISFPAAVSLYWGVSTLFAIGQQLIVNREHLKV